MFTNLDIERGPHIALFSIILLVVKIHKNPYHGTSSYLLFGELTSANKKNICFGLEGWNPDIPLWVGKKTRHIHIISIHQTNSSSLVAESVLLLLFS